MSAGKPLDHYFSREVGRPERLESVTLQVDDRTLDLATADHVFSFRKVDRGTLILIEEMEVPSGGRVLDLGCGYGPLSVCASLRGGCVAAVDVNKRAVWLARFNMLRYAETPWIVVHGNLYNPFECGFDAVVCNPPIRSGRSTIARIIKDGQQYLRDGGSLQLVARTRMGAKTLASIMESTYGNVEVVGRRSGYRVLLSRRRGGRVD